MSPFQAGSSDRMKLSKECAMINQILLSRLFLGHFPLSHEEQLQSLVMVGTSEAKVMSLGSLGPFLRTFRRSRCLVATCTSAKLEITCPALLKCIPYGNPSLWPRKVMQMAPPTASRKLSTEELSMCKPLEGKETTLSEEYPPDMVSEILKGIKMTAREDDPERFAKKTFNALPVQLEQDLNKWTDVFKLVEEHFQRSSHRSRVLASNDPLWRLIKPLVPWHKIERVQIASQPATLRLPMHVPHTHRGWTTLFNDGESEVNSEDLSDVRHPRGRFRKPVNFAIFLLGQADASSDSTPPRPDSLQQPPDSLPPDDPQLQLIPPPEHTGIQFAPELRLTQEVKTAISRLHKNLGHPPAAELKKLLAMQGVRDDHLLRAVEGLRCETCLRTKMSDRPPPSTSKAEQGYHQFGDLLQAGIFYVRDIAGKNYLVLGVICETTHLHAAGLIGSRNPVETADALFNIWFNPYGLPLRCELTPTVHFEVSLNSWWAAEVCSLSSYPQKLTTELG